MSSNEQGHLVREAVSLGVHGFVLKRSELSTLRTAITRVLAGEKFYCPESSRLLVEKMVDEGRTVAVNLTPRERDVLRGFARGENPKGFYYTPQNVLATCYHALGIDVDQATVADHTGRPIHLLDDCRKIKELL